VCERLGAAVDFIVEDEDMREVVDWISENVAFDRRYFYGSTRPIHISFSPNLKREVIELVEMPDKTRMPRAWKNPPRPLPES